MGCPSLAQISCQSEEISQSKSRAEHYWLPACPFLVVISSGCFAVFSKADRLEAHTAF